MSKPLCYAVIIGAALVPLLFMWFYHAFVEAWEGERGGGYSGVMICTCLAVMIAMILPAANELCKKTNS